MKAYNEVLLKSTFELEELDKTVAATEKMLEKQKQKIESLVSNIEWLKANFPMVDINLEEEPEGEYAQRGALLLQKIEGTENGDYFRVKNSKIDEVQSNKFYKIYKEEDSEYFIDETGDEVGFTVIKILMNVFNLEVEFFVEVGELPFDLSKDEVTQ